MRKEAEKFFYLFIMPLLILVIRIEVDLVFQTTYPLFYNNIGPSGAKLVDSVDNKHREPKHVMLAHRLINGVITELIDPNIFFSRVSFLESGKEAIDIKHDLLLGKKVGF